MGRKAIPTLWIRGSVNSNEMAAELNRLANETAAWKGKVNVSLKAITEEAKKTEKGFSLLGKASDILTGAFERLGHKGVDAALSGIGAIGSALKTAFNDSVDFHKQFAEVDTLIPGMSKTLDQMKQSALEMQGVYGQKQQNVIKGFYDTISAGFSEGAEATNIMNVANKLAVAGVTDVGTAVDGITSILNAYGLSGEYAAVVANDFMVAMQKGKTTVGELAANIGTIAPQARAAGLHMDEMFSAVASVTTGGINTDEAITAVNQALVSVLHPSEKSIELAHSLGAEFSLTALQTKGLSNFLYDLAVKSEHSAEATSLFFGNVRALKAVLALGTDGMRKYNENMKDMEDRVNAMDEGFREIADSLGFKLQQWDALTSSFGTALMTGAAQSETVKGIVDGLNVSLFNLQNVLIENIKGFSGTRKEAQAFVQNAASQLLVGLAKLIRTGVGWYEIIRTITVNMSDLGKMSSYIIRLIPGVGTAFDLAADSFELFIRTAKLGLKTPELSDGSKKLLEIADATEKMASTLTENKSTIIDVYVDEGDAITELRKKLAQLQKDRNNIAIQNNKKFSSKVESPEEAAARKRESQHANWVLKLTEKALKKRREWLESQRKYHANLSKERQQYDSLIKAQEKYKRLVMGWRAEAQRGFEMLGNEIANVVTQTQSFEEALKNVGRAIVAYIVKMAIERALGLMADWIANELIKLGIVKGTSASAISAESGVAATAAYASTAAIPIVGPALAPAVAAQAGATAKAMGMGFLAFNQGGVVPGQGNLDSVPILATPGERILSKPETNLLDRFMRSTKTSTLGNQAGNLGRNINMSPQLMLNVTSNIGDNDDTLRKLVQHKIAPMFFKLMRQGLIKESFVN